MFADVCQDPEGVCTDFLLLCSSSSLVLKWMKSCSQIPSLTAEEVSGNERKAQQSVHSSKHVVKRSCSGRSTSRFVSFSRNVFFPLGGGAREALPETQGFFLRGMMSFPVLPFPPWLTQTTLEWGTRLPR